MGKHARLPAFDRAPEAHAAEVPRTPRLRTRYYAFLSYSHRDKDHADWLHRELERFRVPRSLAGTLTANGVVPRRLSPIFRDEQDLSAGGDLAEEIKGALAASQFLVVLCSPTAAKSRWTNQEIESFKRTRPEGCVLAAVVAGEPFASDLPGREEEECFPPALRYKYDRRGHQTAKRVEPLAADFRESGEGKRLAFLKLVAGMLGVGLDELVRREQTRRHRRLAWLAAGSVAGMAVTSTLSVIAIQSRDEARDQRREAEGLVAFMLGDLKDKLEPIGRLDALDGVGSRVLAYYSKQDATELSDAALLQRSRALSLTAQVAFLRGDYDSAERLYGQAMAGTGEAIRRNPDDPERLFDHAQNVFWIGDLARRRGQIDQAERGFRQYWDLANRMVAIQPDNLKWRMEVLYARENLGIVLYNQRRFDEASQLFEGSLGPMQALASVDASKIEYQQESSNVLAWLADARKAMGRFDEAIALRQRQASYLERLLAGGASDVSLQRDLIAARQGLGVLYTFRGDLARGAGEYRVALGQADHLIKVEPSNSMWKEMAASVHLYLAKNLLLLGHSEEATGEATEGCSIAAALRAGVSTVWRLRTLQTTCLSMRTRLALASGARAEAVTWAERALSSARSERSGDAVKDRHCVAAAYLLLGDAHRTAGDSRAARTAWMNALASIPPNVAETPPELDDHAAVLERLGRQSELRPIERRLAEIGYRRIS